MNSDQTSLNYDTALEEQQVTLIDLHRRFIPESDASIDQDQVSSWGWAHDIGVGWDEVLTNRVVVILGEAGSGKTSEFLLRAANLRKTEKSAFVLRLEALARSAEECAFNECEAQALGAWLDRGGPAYAFLDALDEARLPEGRGNAPLRDAISYLKKLAGESFSLLRLVISCRGSEWAGETDLLQLEQVKRTSPDLDLQDHYDTTGNSSNLSLFSDYPDQAGATRVPSQTEITPLPVFALAPLDKERVRQLSLARGVETDQFLDELEHSACLDLARQPLHVEYLIRIWKEDAPLAGGVPVAFRSRTSIFDRFVWLTLMDEVEGEPRILVPVNRLRDGVERLAVADLLLGGVAWRSPDVKATGENAAVVLIDSQHPWSRPEIRQLLATTVFQPAYSGRVRFGVRELRDFLAAKFFARAIVHDGGALHSVDPLFAQFKGRETVPLSTQAALGWLASTNLNILHRVADVRPEILMSTGDPSALTPTDRAAFLERLINTFTDRNYRGLWLGHQSLERFAHPDLSDAIEHLLKKTQSDEARITLIRIAQIAKITSLSGNLLEIALNVSIDWSVRAEAAECIAEFGEDTQRKALLDPAKNASTSSTGHTHERNQFVAHALRANFPKLLTPSRLRGILRGLSPEPRNLYSGTSTIIATALEVADSDQQIRTIKALNNFIRTHRNKQGCFVLLALSRLTRLVIEKQTAAPMDETLLDALCESISSSDSGDSIYFRDSRDELLDTLANASDYKKAIFDSVGSNQGSDDFNRAWRAYEFFNVYEGGRQNATFWRRDDVSAFCEYALATPENRDQRFYFYAAEIINNHLPSDPKAIRTLRRTARLLKDHTLIKRVGGSLIWRSWNWIRRWSGKFAWYNIRHRFFMHQRTINEARSQLVNRWRLARRIKPIRAGQDFAALVWAVNFELNDLGQPVIDAVTKKYGKRIGSNIQSGFRAWWPRSEPDDYSENSYAWLVGLTGLSLDADEGSLPNDSASARKAFVFAFRNLGSLPSWTKKLAQEYPAEFRSTALPLLRSDLSRMAEDGHSGRSISSLCHSEFECFTLIADGLLTELEAVEPANLRDLEEVAFALASRPSIDAVRFSRLSKQQYKSAKSNKDERRMWIWFIAWLYVDPSAAMSQLERSRPLRKKFVSGPLFDLIAYLGENLDRGRRKEDERCDWRSHEPTIARLLKFAFCAAPPENDPVHNKAYSPGAADNAVSARRYLMNLLVRLGTGEAYDSLNALASDKDIEAYRDTFLWAADELFLTAAESPRFNLVEASQHIQGLSTAPRTPEEFRVLVSRHIRAQLLRLRDDDCDEGRAYRGRAQLVGTRNNVFKPDEEDLRNWISGRLSDVGNGLYDQVREPQVSRSKRIDIRLVCLSAGASKIVVEVKLAEAWTGDTLIDRIESQLVHQYMGRARARMGMFVVVHCNRVQKSSWRIKGQKNDFSGLVEHLEKRAEKVLSSRNDLESLEIVAIDLE